MNSKQFLKEGFLEDAQEAHSDHEVQMARVDCYYAAEHAIVLHKLLRNISEEQGLEGWVASKITLANDYLKSVREHLEYQMMNVDAGEDDFLPLAEGLKPVKKNSVVESTAPVAEDEEEKFQDFERGPWYVILKGKAVTVNGIPKKFNWLNGAKTYFRSMMDKNPEMAQNIKREYDEASDKKSVIYYTKNLPTNNITSTEQPVNEGEKPGLWANIRAKRKRIKGGSGERMRKPGSKGAPSEKDLKSIRAASESTENASNTWYDNLTGKYPKTKLALDLLPPTAMATSAVDAVNNLSKGNYSAAALDAAGLIPGVKPLSKFLPRSISIDNISSGRKVARGASTAKDVGDYIDNEFPNEVKESDFHSQFAAMIDDMKKSGQLKTGDPTKSQAKYAPEQSREELTARLRELESEFDPEYQYSDDYSFWTKQNAIAREIASIKKKLGSQGVAEGSNSSPFDQMANLKSKSNKELDELVRFWQRSLEKNPNHKVANDQLHLIKMIRAERIGKKGVAEGSEIKIPTEDGIGWQDIRLLAGEGKLTQKTIKQAIEIIRKQRKQKQGVAEGFKNTYEVGDRVDGPLGTGTIVAVSKNVNIDGRVKVKLDDPSKAGEDGKYKDSFVLTTTQLKHISEQGVAEGSDNSVEALIQMYNNRDQKIVKTKVFRSEDEANRWADRNNATILKLKDIAKKSTLDETTAGSIAGVVNPKIKNKSKVGTLFGGTYNQQKDK